MKIITDNQAWLDLDIGERALVKGKLDSFSPNLMIIHFPDWSVLTIEYEDSGVVNLYDLVKRDVEVLVERTEDGVKAVYNVGTGLLSIRLLIISFKSLSPGQRVKFDYKNHRGEIARRIGLFQALQFGSNEWYPEYQAFLHVYDLEKQAFRSFAIANIIGQVEII